MDPTYFMLLYLLVLFFFITVLTIVLYYSMICFLLLLSLLMAIVDLIQSYCVNSKWHINSKQASLWLKLVTALSQQYEVL